jgi:protocatechuate 3,4-dioxygenase beta subunit
LVSIPRAWFNSSQDQEGLLMNVMQNQIALAGALALALTLFGSAAAEQVQIMTTSPGDVVQFPGPGRQFKTGTGRISGRVIAIETGTPVRRAQVRITGPDIQPKTALTDTDGRFEFRDLPAGRFTLQGTKSGFVTVQYGQTRPFESGRPIELMDNQALQNADIMVPRGSVIAGRIVDEFGEPVPDVMVTAMRQSWAGGRRRMMPVGSRAGQTNDLGQFRLYGLPPGEYYLSATLRGGAEMMAMEMAVMAGAGAGPTASMPSSGYAPTYFPGTPNPPDAQRIAVAVGQEVHNADFALIPVRMARITGIVIGSDGKPLENAMINVVPTLREGGGFMMLSNSARTNRDGAFTLNGVAPGDYMLQANSVHVLRTEDGGGRVVMSFTAGGPGGGDSEFGSVPLSVAGEDIPNLVIVTAKGGTATGRLTFEGGAQPQTAGTIRITAPSANLDGPMVAAGGAAGTVQADGAFELKGLAGARLVRVANPPAGWMLKSVRYNGVDITDTGAEFKAGEAVSGLEVVLTSQTTTVTGSVTAGSGAPLKDYTVVLFAENADYWRLPMTRWVTGTRPDQEGRFKVQNLPPGSYYAVAVDYIAQGEWGDPDLLERFKVRARRFTLDEGGVETLELKLVDAY